MALLARDPTFCDQPLIDFDLALILLPVVLLGVSVGADLQLTCHIATMFMSCHYLAAPWSTRGIAFQARVSLAAWR